MNENINTKKEEKNQGINESTNNCDSKAERQQKDHPSHTGKYLKPIRTSDLLLSIDGEGDECTRNGAEKIKAAKRIPNTIPDSGSKKPSISVVFDECANKTVPSPNSLDTGQQESIVESEGSAEGTMKMLTTKSLMAPLVSIVNENIEDENEKRDMSSIFIREVSTTRKSSYETSEQAELQCVREEERWYSQRLNSQNELENMGSCRKSTTLQSQNSIGPSYNGDVEDGFLDSTFGKYDHDNTILGFQQALERIFSRPPKRKECNGRHDNDDLQRLLARFNMPEHRRCAWISLLHHRQRQCLQQKNTLKIGGERNECDDRIKLLFDAEYFNSIRQQPENIAFQCDSNDRRESPLESILRCVGTEEDRNMSLQSVMVIKDHFIFRQKEQESYRHGQCSTRQGPENKIEAIKKAERIRRLMALFVRLTFLSSGKRRTLLVQTAWETAILLFSFSVRESLSSQSSSISPLYAVQLFCWQEIDLLLDQQLIWQQSKRKPNASKMHQLQEVKAKAENIVKDMRPREDQLKATSTLLQDLVVSMDKLVSLYITF